MIYYLVRVPVLPGQRLQGTNRLSPWIIVELTQGLRVCLERADEYYSSESADTSSYALSVSEGEEELFLPPHPVELVG